MHAVLSACFLLPLALQGSQAAPPASEPESPAAEFLRIGRALYDGECPSIGAEPARTIERLLANGEVQPEALLRAKGDLAREWLDRGRVAEAIELLEGALAQARAEGDANQIDRLQRLLGLSYLRLAENQNCVESHNASCCILPFGDGALHTRREPALKARAHYLALLEQNRDNLEARWLVNLLTMLVGEYPDGLQEDLRIPMRAFATPVEKPWFRDVAPRAGVDTLNLAGGVATEDFDGDGWIDILTSTCDPLGPLSYFRNKGDGSFEDLSAPTHAAEQLGGLNLVAGDYDNDGDKDALVLRGAWLFEHGDIRNSLLRNDGGRAFVDVTRALGLAAPAHPTQTAVFGDLDDNGWLDLYVGFESRVEMGQKNEGSFASPLYLGQDGRFQLAPPSAGVANDRYAKGVTAGDYDNDGDLDLYVSNIGANRLLRNDGQARFEDVAVEAGVEKPVARSFTTWFFDYDNDGWLDLWVGAYSTSVADLTAEALGLPHQGLLPRMYHNSGDGTFQERSKDLGLARPIQPMGANFCDVDNDGWLDFYLGTGDPLLQSLMPNLLFRNVRGARFEDVTAPSGLGHLQKGHGVAFADFDHDGDQDLFHQLGGFVPVDAFQNALFENTGSGGHWLTLELRGTRSNRDGVGARIRVVLETPAGPRELHRAVGSVSSFGGSTHRQEIGLGDATRITRLEIRWPRTPQPQVFTEVPMDAWLGLREDEPGFERLERRSFRF